MDLWAAGLRTNGRLLRSCNIQPQRPREPGTRVPKLILLPIEAASILTGISRAMPDSPGPTAVRCARPSIRRAGALVVPNAAGSNPHLIRNPTDQPQALSSC